jgi:hypothetical protein
MSKNLEELRVALFGAGLMPLSRDERDDPKIVEVWL